MLHVVCESYKNKVRCGTNEFQSYLQWALFWDIILVCDFTHLFILFFLGFK